MNERIEEIDSLEASGILESRQHENNENEENSHRTLDELRTIEELKRDKIMEAVQTSTVYKNLSEIPGINMKEILESIVEMYMNLDAITPGNPEYIDLQSLNLIINSVKEYEIDTVQNGIVTNDDGTIDRISSAEQLRDMSGIPVSEILAQNKGEATLDISNVRKDMGAEQKMFDLILGSCDGDEQKANEVYKGYERHEAAAKKFMEKYKDLEKQQEEKQENSEGQEKKSHIRYKVKRMEIKGAKFNQNKDIMTHKFNTMDTLEEAEFIHLGYEYNIFDKNISEEDKLSFIKEIEQLREQNPNNRFIEKILDKDKNISFERAVLFAKKFERNYNNNKNKNDLQYYLGDVDENDSLELRKMDRFKKREFLTDIYIAAMSGDKERMALATELLLKTKSNGVNVFSENLGTVTKDMALNIINAEYGTKFDHDSTWLKDIIETRKLNSITADKKIDNVKYAIMNSDGIERPVESQKILSKEKDKVKILKDQIRELGMGSYVREKDEAISQVLNKLEINGIDCANALTVKLLYIKLSERDYALVNGRMPQNKEERIEAYKDVSAHTNSKAVYIFMKNNPAIFGDFISEIQQMDVSRVEEMLSQNRLKSVKGNISVDRLMREVDYAGLKGAEKDLETSQLMVELKAKIDNLKKDEKLSNKRKISPQDKAEAKERFEENKVEVKELLAKLPIGYRSSALCMRILTTDLNKRTQQELLEGIKTSIEKDKEKPLEEGKETAIDKFKKWREVRKASRDTEKILKDILNGNREVIATKDIANLGLEDKVKMYRERTERIRNGLPEVEPMLEPVKQDITEPKENKFLKFLQNTFDMAGKAGETIVNSSQRAAEGIGKFVNNLGKTPKDKAVKTAEEKLPKDEASKVEKTYREIENRSDEWKVSQEQLKANNARAQKEETVKVEQKLEAHTGPEDTGGR